MNKKIFSIGVLFALLVLSGCGKTDFSYSSDDRSALMRESKVVMTAVYKKTTKLTEKNLLDFVEGRKGYSNKMENAVFFRTKEFLKGSYSKPEFSVGVNIPSIAFNLQPGEYSGQKKFTLYIAYDEKMKRDVLIGAEWETVKY